MKEAQNKQIIRQLLEEAFNHQQLALLEVLFSPHFIDHSTPDQPPGPQGVRDYFAQVHTGFPDMHVIIEDLMAEGDRIVVRTTWQGTHLGPYSGVAATGRQVARSMIQIFQVIDGKIVAEWNEGTDLLAG